jgi:broad specificity phosphatase PhoE
MAKTYSQKSSAYYLFRHGDTFVTKRQRLWYYPTFLPETAFSYGTKVFSASILDEAKPVIQKLADYLKDIPTDFNTSSQLRRCRQTVQIIEKITHKEFVFDKRLNEFVFEAPWVFQNRVKNFLKMLEQKEFQSVAICTHGAVLALIASILSGKKVGFPKPGVLVIIKGNTITYKDFNAVPEEVVPETKELNTPKILKKIDHI